MRPAQDIAYRIAKNDPGQANAQAFEGEHLANRGRGRAQGFQNPNIALSVCDGHGRDTRDIEPGHHHDQAQHQKAKPFFQSDRRIQIAMRVHPRHDVVIRPNAEGRCDETRFKGRYEPNLNARNLIAPAQIALCGFERYKGQRSVQLVQPRVKNTRHQIGPHLRLLSHQNLFGYEAEHDLCADHCAESVCEALPNRHAVHFGAFCRRRGEGLNAQVEFASPQVRVYVGYVCQLRCFYSPHGDADLNQIPAGGPPKREALGRDKGRGSAHGGQCL